MDETTNSGTFDRIVSGLFGLASKKIETDAAIEARKVWSDPTLYGIDEYGRPYLRGQASSPIGYAAPISAGSLLLVGAVVVAIFAFKN